MNCVIKARGHYLYSKRLCGEDDIIWGYKIVIFQSRAWVKKGRFLTQTLIRYMKAGYQHWFHSGSKSLAYKLSKLLK